MLPGLRFVTVIAGVAVVGVAGCGSDGSGARVKKTPVASVAATPVATSTTPVGPWHETGPEKPVTQKARPSTVTFTTDGEPPLAVFGNSLTTLGDDSGADPVNSPAGLLVVGQPIFDADGTGVVVLSEGPLTPDHDESYNRRLVWATIDRTGATGPVHELSPRSEYAQVASDGDGNAIVAWVDDRGGKSTSPARFALRSAVRRSGGSVGSATTVTTLPTGIFQTNYGPFGPQITAAIGNGSMVVATKDAPTSRKRPNAIQAWTGTVKGGLHRRGIVVGRSAVTLTSAISSAGRAYLAWGDQNSGEEADSPWIVSATSIRLGARKVGPVQQIEQGTAAFPIAPPLLVDDRRGGALLAWSGTEGRHSAISGEPFPVRVAEARADGRFGATQTVAANGQLDDLVVAPNGAAIMTWVDVPDTGDPTTLFASVRPAVATQFAAAERVPAGRPAVIPKPAFDASGHPTVAYATGSSAGEFLHLLTRDAP